METSMKIAIAGASGRAGSCITAELARRGHSVTGIARNPDKIARLANVTAVRATPTTARRSPDYGRAMMSQ
jgi:putative NADH-flavin reductase